ncbi:MAG: alpha/beta hydrolase, partial [Rhodococcus sp. (in: high G+C Gram-positive bacteria)]
MDHKQVTARDGSATLRISGPDSRHTVLLLPGSADEPGVYDGVCERLHNSDLKTIAVQDISGLDHAAILEVLDELSLPWV